MKVGENPKMPYPQCGRSIKTYARGNNDAPSITKYGSPLRLDQGGGRRLQLVLMRPTPSYLSKIGGGAVGGGVQPGVGGGPAGGRGGGAQAGGHGGV